MALPTRSTRTPRPALSSRAGRRLAAGTAVGLSAVVLLGGCGFQIRQQGAAVVNGQVISESDVRTTTEQLTAAKFQFSEGVVLTALIAAPLLKNAMATSGGWQPDATYAQALAAMPDATATTKEFVGAVALIQSQKMTEAEVAKYRAGLKAADISVNPKFGKVVPGEAPVYFSLGQDVPNWIKPGTNTAPPTAP